MDWGSVIWLILAVLGAALIAGGFVAYHGSATAGPRAFGAAAVAAGLVMWAVIALTVPVSVSSGDERPVGRPDIITLESR